MPAVLAKPRKTFLTDYLIVNQVENEGFSNSIKENDSVSLEATAYALEILKHYDLYEEPGWFGEIEANVNVSIMEDELLDELDDKLEKSVINLYDVHFLLKSLSLLNATISSSVEEEIEDFLSRIENTSGGFTPNNMTQEESMVSTYYALMVFILLDIDIDNKNDHFNWILSCKNEDDGFGGAPDLSSNIFSTYCAVMSIEALDSLDDLGGKKDISKYLEDFYVDDEGNQDNYGGFLSDENSKTALLSSTYYCVEAIRLLDEHELDNQTIIDWVLARQNFRDGGFAENTQGTEQKISSLITSYYAFQTLQELDPNLTFLEEEVWMVEFNWIILIIVLSVLGGLIAVAVIIWRRRRI